MNACMASSATRRSGPTISVAMSPSRTLSTSERRSETSGSLSTRDGSTSSPPSSSRTIEAMCGRSHGTAPNCSACVVSCSATQRSSWSASASRASAAWARLGETNSSRAGASGSRIGNSYWPSTRWPSRPEITPTSTASSAPEAAPTAPESGPMPRPRRSDTGSSTVFSDVRLLWIQSERSTGSACGSAAACRPVYAETSRALSSAGPATCSKAVGLGGGLEPGDALGDGGGELPVDHSKGWWQAEPSGHLKRPTSSVRRRARPAWPRCAPPRSASAGAGPAARRAGRRRPGTRPARRPRARSAAPRRRRPRGSGAA